jgi:UDP-N-acetylglucosamine 2-epimerase
VETVEDGWNVLIGASKDKIVEMANDFGPKGKQRDVFGDGKASEKIVEVIKEYDTNFETK